MKKLLICLSVIFLASCNANEENINIPVFPEEHPTVSSLWLYQDTSYRSLLFDSVLGLQEYNIDVLQKDFYTLDLPLQILDKASLQVVFSKDNYTGEPLVIEQFRMTSDSIKEALVYPEDTYEIALGALFHEVKTKEYTDYSLKCGIITITKEKRYYYYNVFVNDNQTSIGTIFLSSESFIQSWRYEKLWIEEFILSHLSNH